MLINYSIPYTIPIQIILKMSLSLHRHKHVKEYSKPQKILFMYINLIFFKINNTFLEGLLKILGLIFVFQH